MDFPKFTMGEIDKQVDVVVVGAGPTGCAAALAFARKGASVLLADAQPDAAKRFAGEWMHPPAVRALRSLGVDTDKLAAVEGHGFVLYGGDGSPPVELPYVRGTGLCRLHHELVEELRGYVKRTPEITYLPYHAFVGLDEDVVRLEDKKAGRWVHVRATRVIGADGRKSRVRAAIGPEGQSQSLSYMMGVELKHVRLPHEGLGHVFFGGPGPALFYRVDPQTIRGCLDVPVSEGPEARRKENVLARFSPILPPSLREAFAHSLKSSTPWAATRFQPRGCFGEGHVWLAGDAVGHVHPVSGMGMTFGILDAVAAAEAESLDEYRRAREVYVSELLTNVLYLVFRRHDESAARVRRGLLKMLRKHPEERRRTMQILTSEDHAGTTFVRSFMRASGYAVGDSLRSATKRSSATRRGDVLASPMRLAESLRDDFQWLRWPLGAFVGDLAGSQHYRAKSSLESPFPRIEEMVAEAEALAKATLSRAVSSRGDRIESARMLSVRETS